MRFAPEGYPFFAVFFVLTVMAALALGPRWAWLSLALLLFMLWFFRDPERTVPATEGFVSPADGKVIVVEDVMEGSFLNAPARQISIFMSPLNVHVNRAPCDGTVREVVYKAGRYKAAYKDEASRLNEQTNMVLECPDGQKILVRQVAGFVARRTVCRKRPGDVLKRGERYGIIKFSSRLDVYLPPGSEIKVRKGDIVRAGETILATAGKGSGD